MNATSDTYAAKDKLIRDFKTVVADAEELLRATAGQTGEKVEAARARIEQSIRATRQKLDDLEEDVLARAKAATRHTDEYVHEHPWQAIGVSAAVGLLFGMLISRR